MAVSPPRRASAGPALGRRLIAELIGTALLVLFGAGSVVAALRMGSGRLDYAGLGMVAIAFAVVVAVVIFAFGTTSGAHINPAVTIALSARGRFPAAEVGPYVLAQVVGAVVGALLIVAAFGDQAVDLGLGGTALAPGVADVRGIVAEALGTFLLVTAVFALAVDRRAPAGWAGLGIGLAVACAILFTAPLTGGSLNPARTFGPLLVLALWDGPTNWGDLWTYVVGPIVGGLLAAYGYDLVARPREAEEVASEPEVVRGEPAQGTAGTITGHRE
jgi:glycerol uptake facilitator protein